MGVTTFLKKGYGVFNQHHVTPASIYTLEFYAAEIPGDQDQVIRVMSLHKSKGLTAKLVIVAGCVAGALPRIDLTDPPLTQERKLQEQRRLFYVAVTRSTDTLVLSSSAKMSYSEAKQMGVTMAGRQGPFALLRASRFLADLGNTRPATIRGVTWKANIGF